MLVNSSMKLLSDILPSFFEEWWELHSMETEKVIVTSFSKEFPFKEETEIPIGKEDLLQYVTSELLSEYAEDAFYGWEAEDIRSTLYSEFSCKLYFYEQELKKNIENSFRFEVQEVEL